jgi:hypothetical protein
MCSIQSWDSISGSSLFDGQRLLVAALECGPQWFRASTLVTLSGVSKTVRHVVGPHVTKIHRTKREGASHAYCESCGRMCVVHDCPSGVHVVDACDTCVGTMRETMSKTSAVRMLRTNVWMPRSCRGRVTAEAVRDALLLRHGGPAGVREWRAYNETRKMRAARRKCDRFKFAHETMVRTFDAASVERLMRLPFGVYACRYVQWGKGGVRGVLHRCRIALAMWDAFPDTVLLCPTLMTQFLHVWGDIHA